MKSNWGVLIFCALFTTYSNAQSTVIGEWKTIDDETGEAKSIIEVYQDGDKYYGKIVEILVGGEEAANCSTCAEEFKGKPMKGVVIMKDLVKDGTEYEEGTITDPENGKTYKCKIWLDEDNPNRLNVRGYIYFLYRTQQWIRAS
ncbi:DUF2147 domain-containing protein [Aquimarina sp. ERC-38]|uniref:DUF2147 domain-containing protein n=1 Tax=Aquimarina sp. ERC-38 TaxID=2949996 RepID=UPI00224625A6|nr:DUF2147 domain-containing protein [Aquimarina sp. ERC-38]UZO80070.1 DUF2147 domain-containing protein [Aquimarina sp. ERC-38]